MANVIEHQAVNGGVGAFLQNALDACKTLWDHHATYRRLYNELNSLSDYELAQMRIPRSMITHVARESALQLQSS